jgi:pimeloyl-ACP methyl ester carboxylesterase
MGDRDRLIPPRLGAELAAEIPGARLVMVEGAGHVLMLERPDVVNEAIAGMLADVQPPKRSWRIRRSRGEGSEQGVA